MKIKIKKRILKKHLEIVLKALYSNIALVPLKGIKIIANESTLTLLVSNGTLSIKEVIEVKNGITIDEPGEILVPGKLFKEVIFKQEEDIVVESSSKKIVVSSGSFTTNLNLLNIDDYPIISFEVFGKEVNVDPKKLKRAIKNVSFAAAEQDNRIILNGVNLKVKGKKMIVSATNSYRLAQQVIDVDSDTEFDITILSKNLKDFLPLNISEEKLTLKVDDTKIVTKVGLTTTNSRLIDGVYPEIEKIIPTNFNSVLTINKELIEKILDKVMVLSEENRKIVKLFVKSDFLSLESKRDEIGNTKISIDKEFEYKGEPFEIVFNSKFFKEAISVFDKKITISFLTNQKPFVVKEINNEKITQLILPHRSY